MSLRAAFQPSTPTMSKRCRFDDLVNFALCQSHFKKRGIEEKKKPRIKKLIQIIPFFNPL